MGEKPDDIVGHKTYLKNGEYSHSPLTRAEADSLWAACEAQKQKRAELMPTEADAIRAMSEAYTRLEELGWSNASYCPKDGSMFKAIEPGSSGIHDCNYLGEWPKGSWWVYDGDMWPSRPCLWKPLQGKEAAHIESHGQGVANGTNIP